MRKKLGLKKPQETNIIEHNTKGTSLFQKQRLCIHVHILLHTAGEKGNQKARDQVRMKGRFLSLGSNWYEYSYTAVWWGDAGARLQSEHSAAEMCHHSAQPRNPSSRRKPSIHAGRNTPAAKRQPRTWLQAWSKQKFYTQAEITVLSLKGLKNQFFKVAMLGALSPHFISFHPVPCPTSRCYSCVLTTLAPDAFFHPS